MRPPGRDGAYIMLDDLKEVETAFSLGIGPFEVLSHYNVKRLKADRLKEALCIMIKRPNV